ncbi:N-formylglutamate amidohydrolase [Nannocystaceae bacterium ST9]
MILETISAAQVGLDASDPLPFEFRPGRVVSPLIVSFPHIGLEWPAELGPRPQVSFPRNADFAVDRLFPRAEQHGAATLRARWSRLVVDLNRAADDVDAELVPDHPAPRPRESLSVATVAGERRPIRNRGVVWRSAIGNIPLLTTLDYAALSQRIARYHAPYHRALELLVARRRQQFGYAIVLDAHSMPGTVAGELVLGTRSARSCGPEVRAIAVAALSGQLPALRSIGAWPLALAIDEPYQGGEVAARFGRPELNVHAIQLEISRAIYMDEFRLELGAVPDPGEALRPASRPKVRSAASDASRKLAALVAAIDVLLGELAREREDLAGRAAAE